MDMGQIRADKRVNISKGQLLQDMRGHVPGICTDMGWYIGWYLDRCGTFLL